MGVQKFLTYCRVCGRRKFFQRFCFWCFEKTNNDNKGDFQEILNLRDSLRIRGSRGGKKIKDFFIETVSGWFPSKDFPKGVNKLRIINREKNEYNEVVKKHDTNIITHECHEPLDKHKKYGTKNK